VFPWVRSQGRQGYTHEGVPEMGQWVTAFFLGRVLMDYTKANRPGEPMSVMFTNPLKKRLPAYQRRYSPQKSSPVPSDGKLYRQKFI